MVFKQNILKITQISQNMISSDMSNFKNMFDKEIKLGLPYPRYGNGEILDKEDFEASLLQKINEVSTNEVLEGKISREKVIDRIKPQF